MDNQVLEQARGAYRAGDFATAAQLFAAAKDASEVQGEVDHLRGNALMRLGRYADAAEAYRAALADAAYGKRGALLTNQGKALVATGDFQAAADAFTAATQDASYATPYKAYAGLGGALMKLGRVAEAGAAYRQAAIDGTNPAPAGSLASLGECFVALGRPEDAIESFRTALDFAGPRDDVRAINASLGEAYVAASRFSDAIDVFTRATSDGIYRLTADQQAAFDRARDTLSANTAMTTAVGNGYVEGVDPLDPLGKSGAFMPDPSDTGFFDLTEQEMVQQDHREMKIRRKHRHVGLKIFFAVLLLLVLAAGGLGFAYTQGMGIPSQQDVIAGLFHAVSDGSDTSKYLASDLDDSMKSVLAASIPLDAEPTIEAMDASMTTSKAQVKVALSRGGEMTYTVDFVRQGLGWAVASLTPDFASDDTSDAADDEGAATVDDAADAAQDADAPAASDEGAPADASQDAA